MKKIVLILMLALMLCGCGNAEMMIEAEPAPEFGVQEYFTAEEMNNELQFVEYSYGCIGFQLFLPADWHYGILEYNSDVGEHGIDFWPSGSGGDVLSLRYYPEPFGVCGTGLVEAEGELPGTGKLRAGYYDGRDYPSFISFYDAPGAWVLINDMGEGWLSHEAEIEKILGSLVLDPGVMRRNEAESIALDNRVNDHDYLRTDFDIHTGSFSVGFVKTGGELQGTVILEKTGDDYAVLADE